MDQEPENKLKMMTIPTLNLQAAQRQAGAHHFARRIGLIPSASTSNDDFMATFSSERMIETAAYAEIETMRRSRDKERSRP